MDTKQTVKNSPHKLRLDWTSIFLLLLGVAFLVESVKIWGKTTKMEPLGTAGWPIIMSTLWVLGMLGIMIYEQFKREPVPNYKVDIRNAKTLRWISLVILMLIYIFIVRLVGFIITTTVFEFALMVSFGSTSKRNLIKAFFAAVGCTLVVYYCYTYAFKIPLPGQL